MDKNRLEAFSDGVLAIIITIMVLEMKVPHRPDLAALKPVLPVFLTYVLSYVYVGIYWNNHHNLLKACRRVNGEIMWANLNLLFWLSLFPFVTGWMGENHFMPVPSAFYGAVCSWLRSPFISCKTASSPTRGPTQSLPPQSAETLRAKCRPCFTRPAS
jgi:uncharacterized membrane protein